MGKEACVLPGYVKIMDKIELFKIDTAICVVRSLLIDGIKTCRTDFYGSVPEYKIDLCPPAAAGLGAQE